MHTEKETMMQQNEELANCAPVEEQTKLGEEEKEKTGKFEILKKIARIGINTCLAVMVGVFLSFVVLYLFGLKPYIVMSGSMEPDIRTGSITFVNRNYDFEDVEVGDVVSFIADNDATVIHRAISINNGMIETQGDANNLSDGFTTSETNFKGVVSFTIPAVGYFFNWLSSTSGMIIGIMVVILLLLADNLLTIQEKEEPAEESVEKMEDKKEESESQKTDETASPEEQDKTE